MTEAAWNVLALVFATSVLIPLLVLGYVPTIICQQATRGKKVPRLLTIASCPGTGGVPVPKSKFAYYQKLNYQKLKV